MGRGFFLAVEGGDGAGKGGVIAALSAALTAAGHAVLTTREPGGTPEAEALRALLVADGNDWEPRAELLLMTAARLQHVARVIRPALAAGKIVICDRFIGSTLAYQGAGRGLAHSEILALHRDFVGDLRPDLTLLLDVDPATGLARSRARLADTAANESRFETLTDDFHTRVRAAFRAQATADPARHLVLDAHQPAAALHAEAMAHILPKFDL